MSTSKKKKKKISFNKLVLSRLPMLKSIFERIARSGNESDTQHTTYLVEINA